MRVIFLLLLFIHTEFALLCLDGNEIKKKCSKQNVVLCLSFLPEDLKSLARDTSCTWRRNLLQWQSECKY